MRGTTKQRRAARRRREGQRALAVIGHRDILTGLEMAANRIRPNTLAVYGWRQQRNLDCMTAPGARALWKRVYVPVIITGLEERAS